MPLSVIRRSFEASAADEEHFPSTIDPRIYHVQLIQRYFGPLGGKWVLDAGCGKGRFARVLLEANAGVRVVALDLAMGMLEHVPEAAMGVCATLTDFPLRGEVFDCVYATESLEHAVDIERAVGELCRVLKPGGKFVVIDKNKEHWGKLETPEWERWFGREELAGMFRKHCRKVECEAVSYWEDVEPDGLFLCWRGEK
ncbi:MAG: class I SAM-dependent methyltransferase [Bryobacter sp.]|nr:class I SAM-dependent methyltransferase [Bryobacter sp.]